MALNDRLKGEVYRAPLETLASKAVIKNKLWEINNRFEELNEKINKAHTDIDLYRESMKVGLTNLFNLIDSFDKYLRKIEYNDDSHFDIPHPNDKAGELEKIVFKDYDTIIADLKKKYNTILRGIKYNINIPKFTDTLITNDAIYTEVKNERYGLLNRVRWYGGKFKCGEVINVLKSMINIVKLNDSNKRNLVDYDNGYPIFEVFISIEDHGMCMFKLAGSPKGARMYEIINTFNDKFVVGNKFVPVNARSVAYTKKAIHEFGEEMNISNDQLLQRFISEDTALDAKISIIMNLANLSADDKIVYIKIKTNVPPNSENGLANYFLTSPSMNILEPDHVEQLSKINYNFLPKINYYLTDKEHIAYAMNKNRYPLVNGFVDKSHILTGVYSFYSYYSNSFYTDNLPETYQQNINSVIKNYNRNPMKNEYNPIEYSIFTTDYVGIDLYKYENSTNNINNLYCNFLSMGFLSNNENISKLQTIPYGYTDYLNNSNVTRTPYIEIHQNLINVYEKDIEFKYRKVNCTVTPYNNKPLHDNFIHDPNNFRNKKRFVTSIHDGVDYVYGKLPIQTKMDYSFKYTPISKLQSVGDYSNIKLHNISTDFRDTIQLPIDNTGTMFKFNLCGLYNHWFLNLTPNFGRIIRNNTLIKALFRKENNGSFIEKTSITILNNLSINLPNGMDENKLENDLKDINLRDKMRIIHGHNGFYLHINKRLYKCIFKKDTISFCCPEFLLKNYGWDTVGTLDINEFACIGNRLSNDYIIRIGDEDFKYVNEDECIFRDNIHISPNNTIKENELYTISGLYYDTELSDIRLDKLNIESVDDLNYI